MTVRIDGTVFPIKDPEGVRRLREEAAREQERDEKEREGGGDDHGDGGDDEDVDDAVGTDASE